jgi:hypothetical protein
MPEGPEVRKAADQVELAIKPFPVSDIYFAFEYLKPYQKTLNLERAVGRGGVCGCGGTGQGATTQHSHSIQEGATQPCAATTVQSAP